MSRRLRLLLAFAALVALSVAALVAYDPTDPPQTAAAATDCAPQPGAHRLGDTLLHVPPKPPVGLVLAFHGAGGTGDGFAGGTGFSNAADRYGFAVLYPSAAAHQFWSLNDKMGTTDLDNLRALLPQAFALACTDRVFATGVSNGGGFAARVGCEMADTFAAVAPVAGGYSSLDPCPDGTRTSVLEIHGSADQIVPYEGRGPDRDGDVREYVSGWARRAGCDARPRISHPARYVTRVVHRHCDAGYAVEHLRLEGTDHGWPGAAPPWPRHHPAGVLARELVWRFFADKRLRRE